jgi:hypothetical protein
VSAGAFAGAAGGIERSRCARLVVIAILAALTFLSVGIAIGRAEPVNPPDVPIGALRWDGWFEGARDQAVLESPQGADRLPYFARHDGTGALRLDGDMEHVLAADVAYARSIGLDYFIFGYYPDTGSWNRDKRYHLALNRALAAYIRLPDRLGVRFALSLNQSFPESDLPDMAEAVARFVAHPDHMRTPTGAAPLFVYAMDDAMWLRSAGTAKAARALFDRLRVVVADRVGIELVIIVQAYDPADAWRQAAMLGADMVTSYTTFAPGDGGAVSFSACADHARNRWRLAIDKAIPSLPTVTIGWDSRPRAVFDKPGQKPKRAWCQKPDRAALAALFRDALADAPAAAGDVPFNSVLVYAWNEFTEGGWMAPTKAEGGRRMADLRAAIGRNRPMPDLSLTFPAAMPIETCPVRTSGLPRDDAIRRCTTTPVDAIPWPCPAGTRLAGDRIRAPGGLEARLWEGGWHDRRCVSAPER